MTMSKMNSELCENALDSLLKNIGTARLQSAEQVDVEPSLLLKILNLTLEEREALVRSASRFVKVEIDMGALDRQLNHICNHTSGDNIENEFLLLGAPLAMMRELFGMHASEFSMRRRVLGLGGENRGRPKANEAAEVGIWDVWYQLRDLEERDRYLKTAEVTSESLLAVWAAVKKYHLYEVKSCKPISAANRSVA